MSLGVDVNYPENCVIVLFIESLKIVSDLINQSASVKRLNNSKEKFYKFYSHVSYRFQT